MKFRWEMLAFICLVILGLNILLWVTAKSVILSSFTRLEEQSGLEKLAQVQTILESDIAILHGEAADEAAWDATYAFMESRDSHYIDSDMADMADLRLNLLMFIDERGRLVYGKAYDGLNDLEAPLPEGVVNDLMQQESLWRFADDSPGRQGIFILGQIPMLLASHPVLTSEGAGPVRGALLMGRCLGPAELRHLEEKTSLSLTLLLPGQWPQGPDPQPEAAAFFASSPLQLQVLNDRYRAGYLLIRDVNGEPAAVLKAKMPRTIYRQGLSTIHYFLAWNLLASLILGLLSFWALQKMVFSRRRLQESEDRFRSIYENAASGILILDAQGHILQANPGVCTALGYAETEMLAYSVFDILHPKDREDARLMIAQARSGQPSRTDHERRYLCKGGSIIWGHTSTSWQDVSSSGVRVGICMIQDVTEQKQAEQSLRESKRRFEKLSREFQTLLDGIPDSLTLLGPERSIIWANRGAAMHHRVAQERLPGMFCHQLVHERAEACPDCPVVKCFQTGEAEEGVDRDHLGREFGVKAFPLKDKAGRVTSVIRLATDITEKMRLREEASRASRLASLGEMAAGVAHEINNPNGILLLNLPLVRDALADALGELGKNSEALTELRLGGLGFEKAEQLLPRLLDEMEGGAKRIKRIVEDMKNYSRDDDPEAREPVDVNAVVGTAIRLLGNSIKTATRNFSVAYGSDLPPLRGSFQRLEQVVINLIQNACQALPDPGRGVAVRTGFDADRRCVMVEVRDEGVGMSAEVLQHSTDPFFTTRRNSGGTGLGLSVSERIVREHGGSLDFDSQPGAGTTVAVMLPVAPEENE